VTEVDPEAVSRAAGVAGWTLFGALYGGPVGALVAGGTAAAIGTVQHQLRQQQRQQQQQEIGDNINTTNNINNGNGNDNNQQQQRRPFFTVTTTSYSSTPWGGTTMSVTSNASGRRRTMTVRDGQQQQRLGGGRSPSLRQMSPVDQRIVQMLMLNAINQGVATPEMANQMGLEELLQQLGHHNDDDGDQRRPGATPEQIENSSSLHVLGETDESVKEQLKENNQTTCNICLEEFKAGDEIRKLNTGACRHAYHKECIDQWLSRVPSCPICKTELK